MDKAIKMAENAVREAEQSLVETVANAYPVNSLIRWTHHGYLQSGFVVRLSPCNPRLFVENDKTERQVWIYSYQIN